LASALRNRASSEAFHPKKKTGAGAQLINKQTNEGETIMKSIIGALVLTALASPSLALPMNTQAADELAAANARVAQEEFQTVRVRPRHYWMYRYGMKFGDPDPRVRRMLRLDPPGNQWE
jgi:hypothetical protein